MVTMIHVLTRLLYEMCIRDRKKLEMIGETSLPDDYKEKVEVFVNAEDKTIRFVDNGLGMTEDEVKEYINQIAFSGATDFLEKYKDKSSEDQILSLIHI